MDRAIMPPGRIVGSTPDFGLSQEAHASRRQRRVLGYAALAAVAIVALIVVFSGADATKPLDLTTTSVATSGGNVTVDPNDLVGLSAQRASDILSRAGFVVAINPVDALGVPAGSVTGVHPSGQVLSGATVTLNVSNGVVASTTSTPDTTPTKKKGKDHGNGNGNGNG